MRRSFEYQGFSHNTTCLIKAFCFELVKACPFLSEITIIRSLSLFSTLLMFREFEIVIWTTFCPPQTLQEITEQAGLQIANSEQQSPSANNAAKKIILNHLINTAYFTKRQVTIDEDFLQYQSFFDQNFQIFQGKHTDWLLLNEPDTTLLTPRAINQRFKQLIDIYWEQHPLEISDFAHQNVIDFNLITNKLVQEQETTQKLALQKIYEKNNTKIVKEAKKSQKQKKRDVKLIQKTNFESNQNNQQAKDQKPDLKMKFIEAQPMIQHFCDKDNNYKETPRTPQKNDLPFETDFFTKEASNLLFNEMTPAQKQMRQQFNLNQIATPNQNFHGGETYRSKNLNDSLMWQTMQSRIFDMQSIIKSIVDGGEVGPTNTVKT